MEAELAIVIPYYKIKFFREALLSIKAQTNQFFKLYIGDDCSTDNPLKIIEEIFGSGWEENIQYNYFDDNLGQISLTKQWERSIDLCRGEKYIWLFGDDDIMAEDAVERFYKFIEGKAEIDLMRFNVQMIDNSGQLISNMAEQPPLETAYDFLIKRLKIKSLSTACEYIFSKKIYVAKKGFVEFPIGWASDDATWINFGEENGIYTIPGKPVSWRFGGNSISSNSKENYRQKIDASILFIRFINSKFEISKFLQLKWLIFQHTLLKPDLKVTSYFLKKLFISRLFSFGFIVLSVLKIKFKKMAAVSGTIHQ